MAQRKVRPITQSIGIQVSPINIETNTNTERTVVNAISQYRGQTPIVVLDRGNAYYHYQATSSDASTQCSIGEICTRPKTRSSSAQVMPIELHVSDFRCLSSSKTVSIQAGALCSDASSQFTASVKDSCVKAQVRQAFQNSASFFRMSPDQMYKVTNPQGICLVINIKNYKESHKSWCRDGSEKDVRKIKILFKLLGFDVQTYEDLTSEEIFQTLAKTAGELVKNSHGCFVCFLMAHGYEGHIFGSDGDTQSLQHLIGLFESNKCKRLSHKPKLFFIQACRGDDVDAQHLVRRQDSLAPVLDARLCPQESDFLICYASVKGSPAIREPESGSKFLQNMCAVVEEQYKYEHIEDMMTEVNNRMKNSPLECNQLYYHSVPEKISRLSKKCYLDPDLSAD